MITGNVEVDTQIAIACLFIIGIELLIFLSVTVWPMLADYIVEKSLKGE